MRITILIICIIISTKPLLSQEIDQKTEKQNKIKYQVIDYINDAEIIYSRMEAINSSIGVKIINVNKKLVDINNSSSQTSFNEEVPKIFETFSNANIPKTKEAGDGWSDQENINFINPELYQNIDLESKTKEKITNLNKHYRKINSYASSLENDLIGLGVNYSSIKKILQYHSDLLILQNSCNKSFLEIFEQLNDLTKDRFFDVDMGVENNDRTLLRTKSGYNLNKTIINRHINRVLNDSDKHYKNLMENFVPSKKDETKTTIELFKKELKEIIKGFGKVRDNSDTFKSLKETLQKTDIYNEVENEFSDLVYTIEVLDLKKINQDLESFKSKGSKDLFKAYDFFNESNFTHYLTPEVISKDLTTLKVSITPKDNVSCNAKGKVYELRIRAKGGVKIDFSTGLFGNFGGNDFLDQSYSYETVDDDSTKQKIVRNDSKNKVSPSIGALMHIYPRTGSDLQLAGSFGLSTTELENVNYHLGASLIFGYSKRLIVSSGISLSKASLINDKFKVGDVLDVESSPDEIPTDSFNRLGFFFSFTYNISKKNE